MKVKALIVAAVAALAAGCAGAAAPTESAAPTMSGASASVPPPTRSASAGSPTRRPSGPVVVRYRIERRTRDTATAAFARVVTRTLTDPRGWQRAGFRLVVDPQAPYVVVLAESAEVDAMCRPYDTYGKYSCQNGPVVALNADRWRRATPDWTGSLAAYRQMLVNHEVGHLLGQHHPAVQCPAPGRLAAVMAQQSTELDGCRPNPWPLPDEIARAARHDEPLAPPYRP
jgi:hypothetical protein